MNLAARHLKFILTCVTTALVLSLLPWGASSLSAKTKIDEDKIYYGDVRKYSRPAVVDAAKVYRQIPAHQEILQRKLTRDDPDYWPLMRKASQMFLKALRNVCQEKGYDLIGEVRTITIDGGATPEITSDVIATLQKLKSGGKPPPATTSPKNPKTAPPDPGDKGGSRGNADPPPKKGN